MMKLLLTACSSLVIMTLVDYFDVFVFYSENTTLADSPFTITQDVAKEIVSAVSGLLLT